MCVEHCVSNHLGTFAPWRRYGDRRSVGDVSITTVSYQNKWQCEDEGRMELWTQSDHARNSTLRLEGKNQYLQSVKA